MPSDFGRNEQVNDILRHAESLAREGSRKDSNKLYFRLLKGKRSLDDLYSVYSGVADNYGDLGKLSKARRWLTKCLKLEVSPNKRASAHCRLAAVASSLGKRDAQLEHCRTALALFDSNADDYDPRFLYDTYRTLGDAYYHNKDFARAAYCLGNSIEYLKEPALLAQGHFFLGDCYSALGAQEKAVFNYQKCLEARPDDLDRPGRADVCREIASAMYILGRKDEGWKCYREALSASKNASCRRKTMEWIANSLFSCGEIEGAVQACKRLADSADGKVEKAKACYMGAVFLLASQDDGRASDWLETSIAIHPTKESKRLRREIHSLFRLRSQIPRAKDSTE